METLNVLKRKLFDEYGGFRDKRIKNLDKGERFIIDDRSPTQDFGSQGLYSYFCEIFADVISEGKVRVVLSGNIPINQGVTDWIASHPTEFRNDGSYLSFTVEKGQEHTVNELAELIESIVAPGGEHYDTSSYKYVCPRTAKSLRRFVNILKEYWNA